MAAQGANPALFRDDDGNRLALDHRRLDGGFVVLGRLAEMGPAPAELRRRPERLADFLDFSSDALPLQLLRSEQLFDLGLLLAERLVLALDLDLFELAQIAQPHVEN